MKIKARAEDFVVEEAADLPLSKRGEYAVYVLTKRGWNTSDALHALSKRLGVPFKDASYGGRKDRYGLTTQFITIKDQGRKTVGVQEKLNENVTFTLAGCMDRPMGPDLIKGNRFEIVVRDLTDAELEPAMKETDCVKESGYPNYFDDQRFGSYDSKQGFIAEKVVKGHYNGALKIYLTHIRPEDKGEEKERKRFLFDNWGKWTLCLEKSKCPFEDLAFNYLVLDPKGFVPILQKIEREEMSLFFSAYQSYLWNEVLRRLVKRVSGENIKSYKGVAGDYLFYTAPGENDGQYLKGLNIPMPASNVRMPDRLAEETYSEVLGSNGVKPPMFNNRKIRQAFFKGVERPAIVIPEGLSVGTGEDEIYKDRKKLVLKFFLPRGSYATMLVKRLFAK